MKLTEEFLDKYADFYCGSDRITIDATRENGACLTRIDSFFLTTIWIKESLKNNGDSLKKICAN